MREDIGYPPLVEFGLRGYHGSRVSFGYGYRSNVLEHLGSREQDGEERDTGLSRRNSSQHTRRPILAVQLTLVAKTLATSHLSLHKDTIPATILSSSRPTSWTTTGMTEDRNVSVLASARL